jgi:hypothetical protein
MDSFEAKKNNNKKRSRKSHAWAPLKGQQATSVSLPVIFQ